MMFKVFLLLLPTLVSAINVKIDVSEDLKHVTAQAFGEHTDIITEKERAAFRISDEDLKRAFEKLDNPRKLNFLTWPWDNMDLSSVRTKLQPTFSVVGIKGHPVAVVIRKHFENSRYIASHWSDIVNSIYTSFSKSDVTVGKNVTYTVTILGSNSFNFSNKWGEASVFKGPVLSLDFDSALKLQHDQALDVVLTATKKTIEVEVEYEVTLSGKVACKDGRLCPNESNYSAAKNINFILVATGRPIRIRSKETIFIEVYTDVHLGVARRPLNSIPRGLPILSSLSYNY